MAEVTWSPEALQDLDDIAAFIARDSEYQASAFVQRLIDAANRLAEFPEAGRVIPELSHGRFRELIEGDYRIMYSIMGDEVRIDAVFHGVRRFGTGQ
ncbi:MAG: type II toxin-antitoxin system RelE/ParE family toxin [Phycisphaerae bacterium]